MTTPPALARLLDGVSRKELAARSAAISAQYRAGRGSEMAVRDPLDALAYAAARLPATRAAVAAALVRLIEAAPDFAPQSLLDLGCGCGAAALAAQDAFPALQRLTLIDRNRAMLDLARALLADAPFDIRAGDLARLDEAPRADLVTMAYVLVEMSEAQAADLARAAFERADMALLLVEPGTPAGFSRILSARAALIEAGARIAAPCPHAGPCPMRAPQFHGFSARVQRSRDHLAVKGAQVPYEDEPYIYLAATRAALARTGARVISRPKRDRAGLAARLCAAAGLTDVAIPARDKAATRALRRIEEGDLWPL